MTRVLPIDVEPCETCPVGVAYLVGFDGVRRCRDCVHAFGAELAGARVVQDTENITILDGAVDEQGELFTE